MCGEDISLSNIQQIAEMADINFILNYGLAYTYTCGTWREGSYSFPTELKMSKPLVNARENTNSSKSTLVKTFIKSNVLEYLYSFTLQSICLITWVYLTTPSMDTTLHAVCV